jgi:hypothetical protein
MLGIEEAKRAKTGQLDNSLARVDTDSTRSLQIIKFSRFRCFQTIEITSADEVLEGHIQSFQLDFLDRDKRRW